MLVNWAARQKQKCLIALRNMLPIPFEGEEAEAGYYTTSDSTTLMTYQNYRKKNVQPMRAYVPGEDLTGISVNKEDTPELGGMIAVNTSNPEDKWYVAKAFFEANYVLE